MKDEAAKFLLALQFLTRIPLPRAIGFTPERMAGTPAYYPLVGIIIGGASALIYWLASLALPPLASAILALAGGLLLTGAFHEDGLADTFDGIGGGLSRGFFQSWSWPYFAPYTALDYQGRQANREGKKVGFARPTK